MKMLIQIFAEPGDAPGGCTINETAFDPCAQSVLIVSVKPGAKYVFDESAETASKSLLAPATVVPEANRGEE